MKISDNPTYLNTVFHSHSPSPPPSLSSSEPLNSIVQEISEKPDLIKINLKNPSSNQNLTKKFRIKDPIAERNADHMQNLSNLWKFENQKIVLERILLSGVQGVAEEGIRVKNKTKKELFPAVKETVQSIQKDLVFLNDESFNLKEKLGVAKNELNKIEKAFCVQSEAAWKIDFYSSLVKPYKKAKKPQSLSILSEYSAMQEQLGCLKVLASEFQRDSNIAQEGVVKLQKDLKTITESHKLRISRLKAHYEEKESDIKDETIKLKTEFRRYKQNAKIELEARDLISKRQADFIQKLYQELGNTKFIIQNPRLRTQYHRKVTNKGKSLDSDRGEVISRALRIIETPESLSLAQTRPVTNDLKIFNKKGEEDESFSFRVVTRIRNSVTPFK